VAGLDHAAHIAARGCGLHNQRGMGSISIHIPVAIILLAGGLLACFLGYRLLRVLLAVYGFVVGVIVATLFVDQLETWLAVAATIAGGLVGMVLAIVAYLAGVALFGAAIGAFVVNIAWRPETAEPNVWVVLGVCLAGALVALALRHYVIMVGTSFGGAWTALVGGLALAGNSAAVAAASGDVQQVYPLVPASTQKEFAIAWFVLGGVALFVQLRWGRGRLTRLKE
jgi:hypothetical protein